jgi:outer membrane protein
MRKILLVVVAGLFVLGAFMSPAFAQDKAAGIKIAYVDVYKAINDSAQGKKAKSELESIFKSKQSALESKGRNIERLRSELEKQGDVLSAEAKKSKAEEYERLAREFQREAQDSQNEYRKKEAELTGRILEHLGEIVVAIGKDGNYTVIMEKRQLLYADHALDITSSVISRLDASSPSASSSKPRKKKK